MNYGNVAQKALKKIRENGGVITIVRDSEEIYNEETNEYEKKSETITGFGILNNYDVENVNGTNILAGDVSIMAVLNAPPKMNDSLTFGNMTYKIVNFVPFAPNGLTVIYYTIQAR